MNQKQMSFVFMLMFAAFSALFATVNADQEASLCAVATICFMALFIKDCK